MLDKSHVDETIEVMEETAYQRDYYAEMATGGLYASLLLKMQCNQKDILIDCFEKATPKHVKAKVYQHFNQSEAVKIMSEYSQSIQRAPAMFSHFTMHLSGNELVRPDSECHFCKYRAKRQQFWEKDGTFWNLVSLTVNHRRPSNHSNREHVKEVKQSIEGVVNFINGDTCVLLPKGWVGKRVRITLMD